MAGPLETALVEAFNAMKEDLRKLLLQENPFVDGVLPAAAIGAHNHSATEITSGILPSPRGGTGIDNGGRTLALTTSGTLDLHSATFEMDAGTLISGGGWIDLNGFDLAVTANTTLSGNPAPLVHTHAAGDITSGAVSIARGGTGQTTAAAALAALGGVGPSHDHSAANITSGILASQRGGMGIDNGGRTLTLISSGFLDLHNTTFEIDAGTLISGGGWIDLNNFNLIVNANTTLSGTPAAAVHTHAAGDITSGTMATARLGSGTANSTTFLRGDQTYAVPTVASHVHAAGDITSGTVATARLGSGSPSSTTALFGDQTYKTAITGGGVGGQVAIYSAGTTLTGDSGFTFNTGTNNLTLSSGGIGIGGAPSSQLTLSGSVAQKSSGTLWDVTSDGRTKIVLGEYTDGLSFLRTLPKPVYFERNGKLGTTKGERGMNFIAQDIEKVAPHWVRYTDCEDPTTKLLRLDLHEMQFAELNAILELAEGMDAVVKRLDRIERKGQ